MLRYPCLDYTNLFLIHFAVVKGLGAVRNPIHSAKSDVGVPILVICDEGDIGSLFLKLAYIYNLTVCSLAPEILLV